MKFYMKKTILIIIGIVLLMNFFAIFGCVKSGIQKDDMMLRFREREAMTFLSALMLGLTSLISLVLYWLKRRIPAPNKGFRFWMFSAIGFFYLCMDEYFMAHEGMDEAIGSLFGKDIKHLNLDNLVIAAFGLIALTVCFCFRKELLRHKALLPFLFLGAVGIAGTVVFHAFERINIVWEVVEESFKILGVSFLFAGYLLTLSSFIKKLSITIPDNSA